MNDKQTIVPDTTAVRVALWRALHLEVDKAPHVLKDKIGLRLAAPEDGWRSRPDMNPQWTAGYRASIVGRARFVEEMVLEHSQKGINQYVVLGAGLDSFAQRHPEAGSRLKLFEIDQPGTQAWKKQRLNELGLDIPEWLKLVPVDFEKKESWSVRLMEAGFDAKKPAIIASTGVSMYLTKEAIASTLREIAKFASGSIYAMTFLLTLDLIPGDERVQHEMVYERARQAGTPFLSFFSPTEIMALARECGFREAKHFSREEMIRRYFQGRADGLKPSNGEEFLVATV